MQSQVALGARGLGMRLAGSSSPKCSCYGKHHSLVPVMEEGVCTITATKSDRQKVRLDLKGQIWLCGAVHYKGW